MFKSRNRNVTDNAPVCIVSDLPVWIDDIEDDGTPFAWRVDNADWTISKVGGTIPPRYIVVTERGQHIKWPRTSKAGGGQLKLFRSIDDAAAYVIENEPA